MSYEFGGKNGAPGGGCDCAVVVPQSQVEKAAPAELCPSGQQAATQVVKLNKNHFSSSPKLGEVDARSADGGV